MSLVEIVAAAIIIFLYTLYIRAWYFMNEIKKNYLSEKSNEVNL